MNVEMLEYLLKLIIDKQEDLELKSIRIQDTVYT